MPLPYVYGSAEFRINTFFAGANHTGYTITPLAGGGFVVLWTASYTSGDVKARIFDADGNPFGGDLTLWEGTGAQLARDVLGTPDGGFLIAFAQTGGLFLQRYTAFGIANGSPILVDNSGGSNVELVERAGGGFTIVWSVNDEGIHVQDYEADGDPDGPPFEILAPDLMHVPVNPTYVPLANGGFAIGYAIFDSAYVPPPEPPPYDTLTDLIFKVYDNAGVLVATYDDFGIDADEIEVVALAGGGFAMLYDDDDNVLLQMFDEDFAPDGDPVFVAGFPGGNFEAGALAALPGGGFIATWSNGFGASFDNGHVDGGIEAQIFDASGAAQGARFRLNDGQFLAQSGNVVNTLPEVTVLENGDIVVIWRDVSPNQGTNGNIQARILIPATALPVIDGTGVGETVTGTNGAEVLNGLGGDDVLRGLDGNDAMFGGEGADYIVGIYNDSGFDELHGGAGNDVLLVDYYDRVYEEVGGGFDNVCVVGSYFLPAGAEIELLSTLNHAGRERINLRGNEFSQVIIGNEGNNELDGGGGVDWMDGFGDGDIYYTDGDDIIIELASNGGTDEVRASASYRLTAGSYVERLVAFTNSGSETIDLTGNEVGQIIIGNNGQNGLDGGGGADTLSGRGGNDFYFVDSDDVIQEEQQGQGFDNVMARSHYTLGGGVSAEVLSTTNHSGTDNINLTGNGVAQVIIGNAGINFIDGSDGNDRLVGMGNADHFTFSYALGNSNIDTIVDFDADDTIRLENFVFVGLPSGALNPNAFVLGTAAADADDRIIYDAATGRLFFDLDGTGAGNMVHFATLENHFALTAADFTVF